MSKRTAKNEIYDNKVLDLEVKDAQIIFNSVWTNLLEEFGEEELRFPKEIFWLTALLAQEKAPIHILLCATVTSQRPL